MFSPDALDDFLARNGLSHVIRAHEVKEAGFQVVPIAVFGTSHQPTFLWKSVGGELVSFRSFVSFVRWWVADRNFLCEFSYRIKHKFFRNFVSFVSFYTQKHRKSLILYLFLKLWSFVFSNSYTNFRNWVFGPLWF